MEARARIGRLIGRLGEVTDRPAALAALDKELPAAGLSWGAIAEMVAHGELPGGEREKLLSRLVMDRLRNGLACAWAFEAGGAAFIRQILQRGIGRTSCTDLEVALGIDDDARRKAGLK